MERGASITGWELGKNAFLAKAKCTERQFLTVISSFLEQSPVSAAASNTGLSRKTVRGFYLDLRARLMKSEFRRWNCLYSGSANVSQAEANKTSIAVITLMHRCWSNTNCWRNWRLGNRKERPCRSCQLDKWMSPLAEQARLKVDEIRAFYKRLGISEGRNPSFEVFLQQVVHMDALALAAEQTRRSPQGKFSIGDGEFLSIGTLMGLLLVDIVLDPENANAPSATEVAIADKNVRFR